LLRYCERSETIQSTDEILPWRYALKDFAYYIAASAIGHLETVRTESPGGIFSGTILGIRVQVNCRSDDPHRSRGRFGTNLMM
jgi:hypothetical protein